MFFNVLLSIYTYCTYIYVIEIKLSQGSCFIVCIGFIVYKRMLKGPPHLLDREVLHTSPKFSIPLIKIRNFSMKLTLK